MFSIVPKNGAMVYYIEGYKEINGLYVRNHLHGKSIDSIETEISYVPKFSSKGRSLILSGAHGLKTTQKFYLFELENEDRFMEYEIKDWQWLDSIGEDSPDCCKIAFNKGEI